MDDGIIVGKEKRKGKGNLKLKVVVLFLLLEVSENYTGYHRQSKIGTNVDDW